MTSASYTPPLGYRFLTPLYDRAIHWFTREKSWRQRLVELLDPQPGELILDVGSGTGSLGVSTTADEPRCKFHGLDPDPDAVARAQAKARSVGSLASFEVGFLSDAPPNAADRPDKVVSSLVIHQVPVEEKRRLLAAMANWLKPGGTLLLADYGEQRSLRARLAFRLTVQLLDGVTNTQPNADGAVPALLLESGFADIRLMDTFLTPSGSIDIFRATNRAFA